MKERKERMKQSVDQHIWRLKIDDVASQFIDDQTTALFERIKEVVKEEGANYEQTRKALIMVDESFYKNLIKMDSPFVPVSPQ